MAKFAVGWRYVGQFLRDAGLDPALAQLAGYPRWSDAFNVSVQQRPCHVAGYLAERLAAGIRRLGS
jgi:hypothetical protein